MGKYLKKKKPDYVETVPGKKNIVKDSITSKIFERKN